MILPKFAVQRRMDSRGQITRSAYKRKRGVPLFIKYTSPNCLQVLSGFRKDDNINSADD